MAERKTSSEKKIIDLKFELLKNVVKRKSIKKEIARLLTMENQTKLDGKTSSDVAQDKEDNK